MPRQPNTVLEECADHMFCLSAFSQPFMGQFKQTLALSTVPLSPSPISQVLQCASLQEDPTCDSLFTGLSFILALYDPVP